MDVDIYVLLKQLALEVKKTVDKGLSDGTIQPELKVYKQWKVDKFEYTDKGITERGAHLIDVSKSTWFNAGVEIQKLIEKSNEYSSVLEQLTITFGENKNYPDQIRHFLKKFVDQFLSNPEFDEKDIESTITTFLSDLKEEPVKYGAVVNLEGVIIKQERIDIDHEITLRQPRIEDFETEFSEHSFMLDLPRYPSAILNIEFIGRNASNIRSRVELSIAILRLFNVGSIKLISYRMFSDSITDIMAHGTLTSGDKLSALETYVIANDDSAKLKKFWQQLSDSIPKSFYEIGETKVDYSTIAYKRYSDALLQNGIFERRVANAIMGLEALYFKPDGEMQELAYRLRIRVSKLLGLMGYDPYEVKSKINDAYGIRSTFLHGGHLDYKKKRKLESKYKDIKVLLLSILEYLRISILIMILLPKEKIEFIDLIDDSLIDNEKENILSSITSGVRELMK